MAGSSKNDDVIYRPSEVADRLGMCTKTVRRLYDRGEIGGFAFNNRGDLRIPRRNLLEFMNRHGIPDQGE